MTGIVWCVPTCRLGQAWALAVRAGSAWHMGCWWPGPVPAERGCRGSVSSCCGGHTGLKQINMSQCESSENIRGRLSSLCSFRSMFSPSAQILGQNSAEGRHQSLAAGATVFWNHAGLTDISVSDGGDLCIDAGRSVGLGSGCPLGHLLPM